MAQFRPPANPSQGFLLPPSPKDWLPENHLVWFIMDTVAELDIEELLAKYRMCGTEGKGELAYSPQTMLSLRRWKMWRHGLPYPLLSTMPSTWNSAPS
ncbi:MAG: hypothetical protein ABIP94_23935 [Planctomycetota bacterium]